MEKSTKKIVSFPDLNYGYNPVRDLQPVSPDDVINLAEAFANGFIPDNVVIGDSDYDNNEDPRTIIGRPVNDFEATHYAETLKELAASRDAKANPES